MALQIHNTRTGRKEPFRPREDGVVRMYVCGPTTYDLAHLGHARSYVAFDVIRRYLEFLGYRVEYVQNFTDVEDIINRRAQREGVAPLAYAARYIEEFRRDMARLRVRPADVHPKVSDHVADIVGVVSALIDRGYAYAAEGDVYFRIGKAKTLGLLAHRKPEDMLLEDVPPAEVKEHPLDFALWKRSKPGEPAWDSPWGKGRPGWHVECYAMATKYLGERLDIHGGGTDLIFPHHESEVMVSEPFCGDDWCRYWLHNGFLTIERTKMSKSLGNFIPLRQVLDEWGGAVVRLCLVKSHYREDVEYDADCFRRTKEEHGRIAAAYGRVGGAVGKGDSDGRAAALVKRTRETFFRAMDDDFETNDAFYALLAFAEGVHDLRSFSLEEARAMRRLFDDMDRILGLFLAS